VGSDPEMETEPDGATRPLHIVGDGGYANEAISKRLPANASFVGRIRKDAKLHFQPGPPATTTSPEKLAPSLSSARFCATN
jgi:hypothetical protein